MTTMINTFLISLFCLTFNSQNLQIRELSSKQITDTICNYIVKRGDLNIVLPESFDLKSNQRGFVMLELVIDSNEKVSGWKLNLFRIMENDSIIRHYSRYTDEKVPADIESLFSKFDDFIRTINIRAIEKESIDPKCSILYRLKLNKD